MPSSMDLVLLSNQPITQLPFQTKIRNSSSNATTTSQDNTNVDQKQKYIFALVTSTNGNRSIICSTFRSKSSIFLKNCVEEGFKR